MRASFACGCEGQGPAARHGRHRAAHFRAVRLPVLDGLRQRVPQGIPAARRASSAICSRMRAVGEIINNCRGGAYPSRRNAADSHRLSIKTRKPIASVAALTAQPLAALPPYGCGVPLRAVSAMELAICAALPLWRKAIRFVIARSEATWQSRRTRPDNREVIGEIATAFPRLHPKALPRASRSGRHGPFGASQ